MSIGVGVFIRGSYILRKVCGISHGGGVDILRVFVINCSVRSQGPEGFNRAISQGPDTFNKGFSTLST